MATGGIRGIFKGPRRRDERIRDATYEVGDAGPSRLGRLSESLEWPCLKVVPRVGYDGRGLWRRLGRSLRRFGGYLKTIGKPCRAETHSTMKVPS